MYQPATVECPFFSELARDTHSSAYYLGIGFSRGYLIKVIHWPVWGKLKPTFMET